jgi:trehalose 6-phosphate synthase
MAGPLVASNRGPVTFTGGVPRRGGGGLVTAVGPALTTEDGSVWLAAAGTTADRAVARHRPSLTAHLPEGSLRLELLPIDQAEYDAYYNGVANEVLWPLLHQLLDLSREPSFDDTFGRAWRDYREVNERFADACAAHPLTGGAFIQDYHLALVPALLRNRRPDAAIAHYTHCPFAEPAALEVLPAAVRTELLAGMLGADLLCFEVPRWQRRFLRCAAAAGYPVDFATGRVTVGDRVVSTGAYPLGVDAVDLRRQAATQPVRAECRRLRDVVGERTVIVRVDRMEPSKNILRGLAGYRLLLDRHPDLHGTVTHLVYAYGSRTGVAAYRRYADDVEQAAHDINRTYGTPDWCPVVLHTEDNYPAALAAMSIADVVVVNPVWDGQNMVAKEAPTVAEHPVVLVLSANAGAADDLADGAVVVNPFDVAELATALETAVSMPAGERQRRHRCVIEAAKARPPAEWFAAQRADLAVALHERAGATAFPLTTSGSLGS